MELKKLLKGTGAIIEGDETTDVKDVTADSNSVGEGSLFICINGGEKDGHRFAAQAEKYGAAAIVCERRLDVSVPQAIVKDSRAAMSLIASNFYGNPEKSLRLVAVTGTNGKTTTTHFITSVLMNAGVKCGLIGTLGTFYAGKFLPPSLTTPDPLVLYKIFAEMERAGVETVVMEVSAHAAYLRKTFGLKFEAAVFTNLTQDHLDFFGDMENYKKAKLDFFRNNECKYVVSNSDDETGREIANINGRTLFYGIDNPADVFAIDIKEEDEETSFVLNLFDRVYRVRLALIGKFNVYNALAAATACALLGVSTDKVAEGLYQLKGVEGRLENVYSGRFSVYIDYAHTPDGLKNALSALRGVVKKRLICVFGCGGNRDEKKRRIMGEISGKYADFTVITSDNPRYEEPMDIIWEIEKGVLAESKSYVIVERREEAIAYALNMAKTGDVVLIAGKGAERYQEVFGIKRPYNDKDTVEELLACGLSEE